MNRVPQWLCSTTCSVLWLLGVLGCSAEHPPMDPDIQDPGLMDMDDMALEDEDTSPSAVVPSLGLLSGELVMDDQVRMASAIFAQGDQGSTGAVVVPLSEGGILALTLTQMMDADRSAEALTYSISARCASDDASSCAELPGLFDARSVMAITGEEGKLILRLPAGVGDMSRLELRAPKQHFEPHDGFRPMPLPDGSWPPPLDERPEVRVVRGRWTGSLISLTAAFTPDDPLKGGGCVLWNVGPTNGSEEGGLSFIECSENAEFDSDAYYNTFVEYPLQNLATPPDLTSMSFEITRPNGSTWRFDGQIWSEVIMRSDVIGKERRHRLYHYNGTIAEGSEMVGAFSFVSWGDE